MIKSGKQSLIAFGLFLLILSDARSQDNDDAIPAGLLQIINPHELEMTFDLYENGDWRPYKILPKSDEVLDTVPIYFRIETDLGNAVSDNSNSALDVLAISDFEHSDTNFVRKLTGGKRWFICWSDRFKQWAIDVRNGLICE